ncbi:apolipoprotein N-acyltransferase [Rhabdochlamydiaceae symbiont of Dictyostelium giganteum]|uniref:apolipoprotein N-acyltransferase n=1 Tax=Rhabdochlamydiaceae symbiont of Dictyostelium giganteum TaxID=3342349 RepID=UPI003850BC86
MKKSLFFFLSGCIVAFGQPAWVPLLGVLSSTLGYALFWKECVSFLSPKGKFFAGWAWFTCIQLIQLSWMSSMEYQGVYILGVYALLALFMGLQFGLLTTCIKFLPPFILASLWTLMEWMRLHIFCGFSWNPAGLSLTTFSYPLQFASLFGLFGLSFWVIATNAYFLEKKWKIGLLLAIIPYLWGYGQLLYYDKKVKEAPTLQVALVQTALLPSQKNFFPGRRKDFIHPEEQWRQILTLLAKNTRDVDLIVMPESAVPFTDSAPLFLHRRVCHLLKTILSKPLLEEPKDHLVSHQFWTQAIGDMLKADVIVGLDAVDRDVSYASAFFYSHQDKRLERYDKTVLLPLVEYLPWTCLRALSAQYGINHFFTPGLGQKVFSSKVKLATLICYEETFGEIVREAKNQGATLLANVINDNWYPHSRLPQQHLDLIRVHAVASGIPVVRSGNAGITCVLDSLGRVVSALEKWDEPGILIEEVPLFCFPTLYMKWGNGLIVSISLLCILGVLIKNAFLMRSTLFIRF